MTTALPAAATPEVTEIDSSARGSLFLLLSSGLFWLVLSGALALVNLVQLASPGFLADCSVFTFGRTQGMQEATFIYGWAGNAGLAVGLWILARLGGSPLRSLNWVKAGTVFWNLSLTIGLIGIAIGDGNSHAWLHLPRYVLPMMLVAYGAIGVSGVLAWTGRNRDTTYAAQWYAVAALFLFPWLFTIAQMMLMFGPARGVLQTLIAGWFVQGAWSLWLAPLALGAAYYLVPKITGRVISNYGFAALAFWLLVFIGPWTGGRHLIGGPIPAWVPTLAIVSSALLLFHYILVAVNFRGFLGGAGSTVLKFVAFGLCAYLLGGLFDAVTAQRGVAMTTQFTYIGAAQTQLALSGVFSMVIFGAIYFMAPRLAGCAWPSGGLVRAHYAAAVLGTLGLVVGLWGAGWVQGHALNDASVTFAAIAAKTRPWLLVAGVAQAVLLFGNILFALHLCWLAANRAAPALDQFRPAPAMEAPVS